MRSPLVPVGVRTGLHLFEPRYRWMCARLLGAREEEGASAPPPLFGWLTDTQGRRGSLCEIVEHELNPNGTLDVLFVCVATFRVLEWWSEEVPAHVARGAPSLQMAYVEYTTPLLSARNAERALAGRLPFLVGIADSEEDDNAESEDGTLDEVVSDEHGEAGNGEEDAGALAAALREVAGTAEGWHFAQ
eukprot:TRINITY_DN7425_c0_g1_i2.p2 TRINITY_DN7425_c0_g1~~TRINITY_DN7425_c0_g1_i2.p2  ORF type:complete len:189 (-),score=27.57 TRINITY_DN7425_c0_g1_i2:48-614(-)